MRLRRHHVDRRTTLERVRDRDEDERALHGRRLLASTTSAGAAPGRLVIHLRRDTSRRRPERSASHRRATRRRDRSPAPRCRRTAWPIRWARDDRRSPILNRGRPGPPGHAFPGEAAVQTVWKGTIAFGLVSIPVRLVAATEEHDVSFRQVHRERRLAHPLQAGLRGRGRGGALRRDRQGLRAGDRRDGGDHRRGPRRPAGADHPRGRGARVRAGRAGRPGRVHPRLLRRAHRRRQALRAAARHPRQQRQGGRGQDGAAPARASRGAAGHRRRARRAGDAVARRGAPPRLRVPVRGRHRAPAGAGHGRLVRRGDDGRLRPRRLHRRLPPARSRRSSTAKAAGHEVVRPPEPEAAPSGVVDLMEALRRSVEQAAANRAGAGVPKQPARKRATASEKPPAEKEPAGKRAPRKRRTA